MPKNILYLTDNYIYLKNTKTKKITKINLPKNIVINGKVANINKFLEKLEKITKEYNLNNKILGEKIKVITSCNYTNADITLLKNIFEKLNYRQIIIESEVKYYKLNNNKAWLNILDNYLILAFINQYQKKETCVIENNFFVFEDKISKDKISENKVWENKISLEELFRFIKNKIGTRELYLLGNGALISSFYDNFEKKYFNKTYLFNNHETFLIELCN